MSLKSLVSLLSFVLLIDNSFAVKGVCRLNVLVVILDDWRTTLAPYFPAHNMLNQLNMTKNFKEFASDALLFDNAYCSIPMCAPSRGSFMSGRSPSQASIYNRAAMRPSVKGEIPDIPKHFKRNGYYVAVTGKIYHGRSSPVRRNKYIDERGQFNYQYKTCVNMKGKREFERYCTCTDFISKDCSPQRRCYKCADNTNGDITENWIRQFKQKGRQPWLIMSGFVRPHSDFIVPTWIKNKYEPLFDINKMKDINVERHPSIPNISALVLNSFNPKTLCKGKIGPAEVYACLQHFYKNSLFQYMLSVESVDYYFGRILQTLKETGQYNNTVILLTSDHGFATGDSGMWGKWNLFEHTARVPLIIRSPTHSNSHGKRTAALFSLTDMASTLSGLAGLKKFDPLYPNASKDYSPVFQNQSIQVRNGVLTVYPRCQSDINRIPADVCTRHRGKNAAKILGISIRTKHYRYTEWRHIRVLSQCRSNIKKNRCPNVDGCVYMFSKCIADFNSGIDWSSSGLAAKELYDHTKTPILYDLGEVEKINVADEPKFESIVNKLSKQLKTEMESQNYLNYNEDFE